MPPRFQPYRPQAYFVLHRFLHCSMWWALVCQAKEKKEEARTRRLSNGCSTAFLYGIAPTAASPARLSGLTPVTSGHSPRDGIEGGEGEWWWWASGTSCACIGDAGNRRTLSQAPSNDGAPVLPQICLRDAPSPLAGGIRASETRNASRVRSRRGRQELAVGSCSFVFVVVVWSPAGIVVSER